jgi:hypothetical protein
MYIYNLKHSILGPVWMAASQAASWQANDPDPGIGNLTPGVAAWARQVLAATIQIGP